jgi:hypothetical protein
MPRTTWRLLVGSRAARHLLLLLELKIDHISVLDPPTVRTEVKRWRTDRCLVCGELYKCTGEYCTRVILLFLLHQLYTINDSNGHVSLQQSDCEPARPCRCECVVRGEKRSERSIQPGKSGKAVRWRYKDPEQRNKRSAQSISRTAADGWGLCRLHSGKQFALCKANALEQNSSFNHAQQNLSSSETSRIPVQLNKMYKLCHG